MITWATVTLICAAIVGVAMTVTCGVAISDPFLESRWKFRTVWAGLAISVVFVIIMLVAVSGIAVQVGGMLL